MSTIAGYFILFWSSFLSYFTFICIKIGFEQRELIQFAVAFLTSSLAAASAYVGFRLVGAL